MAALYGGLHTSLRAESRPAARFPQPLECVAEELCANEGCGPHTSCATDACANPAADISKSAPLPVSVELSVCAPDGKAVLLPAALVASSPILQNFVIDEIADSGWAAGTDCSLPAALPFVAGALELVAHAFFAGGRPLHLCWDRGDDEGQAVALGALACAHYLDVQPLVAEVCQELARSMVLDCASAMELAEYIGAPAAGILPPEAEDLVAVAPALGDMGAVLAAAWAHGGLPMSQLPQVCMSRLLVEADGLLRAEPALRELLAATMPAELSLATCQPEACVEGVWPLPGSPPCAPTPCRPFPTSPAVSSPPALSRCRSSGSEASTCSGGFVTPLARALGLVAVRHERYTGSRLLIGALVSILADEQEAAHARVLAAEALTLVAHPGDAEGVDALIMVLHAGLVAGGGLPMDAPGGAPEDATAEGVARRLGLDGCCEVREAACTALVRLAMPGDARALEALAGLVGHRASEVRRTAVASLRRVALPGDLCAMMALARALRDDDWRVREAAGEALAQLAAAVDTFASGAASPAADAAGYVHGSAQGIIAAMCKCLTDSNPDVRIAARSAIQSCVAQCGPLFVATLLLPILAAGDPAEEAVRVSALEVVGDALQALLAARAQAGAAWQEIPSVGCARLLEGPGSDLGSVDRSAALLGCMLSVLSEGLASLYPKVRIAARDSLGRCGGGSPPPADVGAHVVQLASAVAARVPATAAEALEVMRWFACQGDAAATAAAHTVLQQSLNPSSGCAACAVLRDVALVGDEASLRVLCESLQDPDLQADALAALESIAAGSLTEVRALSAFVSDHGGPPERRAQALRCLTRLVPIGNARVLALTTALLEDADPGLRSEALLSAARLAHRGDAQIQAAVINTLLGDEDAVVRERACIACEALLEHGETEVIQTIVGHVCRGEFGTRQSGVRTLERIVGCGNDVAIDAVIPWMDSGHWPQRQGATEAIARLATPGDARVVAAVLRRLHDNDENCRVMACETLSQIAVPGDAETVAALVHRLDSERNWIVRLTAAETLAALLTRDLVELLQPLLAQADEELRSVAEEALCALEAREAAQVAHGE